MFVRSYCISKHFMQRSSPLNVPPLARQSSHLLFLIIFNFSSKDNVENCISGSAKVFFFGCGIYSSTFFFFNLLALEKHLKQFTLYLPFRHNVQRLLEYSWSFNCLGIACRRALTSTWVSKV